MSRGCRLLLSLIFFYLLALTGCGNVKTNVSSSGSSSGGGGSTPITEPTAAPPTTINLASFQIQGIANGAVSKDYNPSVSGQLPVSAAGGTVLLFADSGCTDERASATVDGTGAFSTSSFSFAHDGTEDGTRNYYGELVLSGSTSVCVDMGANYVLDTLAPAGPSGFSFVAITNGGVSNDQTPTVAASGLDHENGGLVQLYDSSTCTAAIGSATIASGAVQIQAATYPSQTADGKKTFYARITDVAGNASGCGSLFLSYTLDTTPPAAPVLSNWTIVPWYYFNGTVRANTNPEFDVTGLTSEAGGQLIVYSDSTCSTQVGSGSILSTYTSKVTDVYLLGGGMDDGPKTFYAVIQDRAGNNSTCASVGGYTLETVAPYFAFDTSSLPSTVYGPFVVLGTVSETLCCRITSYLGGSFSYSPGPFAVQNGGVEYIGGATVHFLNSPNATVTMLVQGLNVMLYVQPTATGPVNIQIPAGAFYDVPGNPNAASSTISVQYVKPVEIGFTQRSSNVSEKAGAVSIGLTASAPVPEAVTVHYEVLPTSTATSSHDTLTSGSVIIPAGASSGQISFSVIDSTDPFNRQLVVAITQLTATDPSEFVVGQEPVHKMVIWDDETRLPAFQSISIGRNMLGVSATMDNQLCGIGSDNLLRCWGHNSKYQVGDGTNVNKTTPVLIDGTTTYQSVTAGPGATCAITMTGVLKCWGDNSYGRLGTTSSTTTPVVIDSGVQYAFVAMGLQTTCGITTTGQLKCWGHNNYGQVGDGTSTDTNTPAAIDVGTTYTKVSLAIDHTCGLTSAGLVKCWGSNSDYQIGDGTQTARLTPTASSMTDATDISTTWYASCAIGSDKKVKCWGSKSEGQSGKPSTPFDFYMQTPTVVDGDYTYSKIYAADYRTCGLTTGGAVRCWLGGIGTNDLSFVNSVVDLDTDTYSQFSMGDNVLCGETTGGDWKCWGDWDGDHTTVTSPELVQTDVSGSSLFLSDSGSCLIPSSGSRSCWGADAVFYENGQVNSAPRALNWPIDFVRMSGNGSNYCGITSSSDLYCWGSNTQQQMGVGLYYSSYDTTTAYRPWPANVDPGTKYTQVSVGYWGQVCGITTAGTVKCWGNNQMYQTGTGAGSPVQTPTAILSALTFTKVVTGGYFSCALSTAGNVYCWGWEYDGELGDGGTSSYVSTPVEIDSTSTYIGLWAGNAHACGILSNNTVKCWGYSYYYQTGTGSTSNVTVPTAIDASTTYSELALGSDSSCGITTTGVLKCWGDGPYAGTGGSNATTPTVVDSGVSYQDIQINGDVSCGITTSNQLKCWGANNREQFGDGIDLIHAVQLPF